MNLNVDEVPNGWVANALNTAKNILHDKSRIKGATYLAFRHSEREDQGFPMWDVSDGVTHNLAYDYLTQPEAEFVAAFLNKLFPQARSAAPAQPTQAQTDDDMLNKLVAPALPLPAAPAPEDALKYDVYLRLRTSLGADGVAARCVAMGLAMDEMKVSRVSEVAAPCVSAASAAPARGAEDEEPRLGLIYSTNPYSKGFWLSPGDSTTNNPDLAELYSKEDMKDIKNLRFIPISKEEIARRNKQ